jgi:hypothetical protein
MMDTEIARLMAKQDASGLSQTIEKRWTNLLIKLRRQTDLPIHLEVPTPKRSRSGRWRRREQCQTNAGYWGRPIRLRVCAEIRSTVSHGCTTVSISRTSRNPIAGCRRQSHLAASPKLWRAAGEIAHAQRLVTAMRTPRPIWWRWAKK